MWSSSQISYCNSILYLKLGVASFLNSLEHYIYQHILPLSCLDQLNFIYISTHPSIEVIIIRYTVLPLLSHHVYNYIYRSFHHYYHIMYTLLSVLSLSFIEVLIISVVIITSAVLRKFLKNPCSRKTRFLSWENKVSNVSLLL